MGPLVNCGHRWKGTSKLKRIVKKLCAMVWTEFTRLTNGLPVLQCTETHTHVHKPMNEVQCFVLPFQRHREFVVSQMKTVSTEKNI
jgi:hypothetical protein